MHDIRSIIAVAVAVGGVIIVGCDSSENDAPEVPSGEIVERRSPPPDTPAPGGYLRGADSLPGARERWKQSGLQAYRFDFQWDCACPPEMLRIVRMTVEDGIIRSMFYVDDMNQVPPERWSDYKTIDELFDLIDQAYQRNADVVTASYDPTYGYPVFAVIDDSEQADDDDLGFAITNVTPLEKG